jgi:hypothetical protein
MLQQQKQDSALRKAAGLEQGVGSADLAEKIILEKNKTFAPQAPNETQQLLDFISKGQGMGGVLNNAAQPGSEMPGTVPAVPPVSAAPSSDMLLRGIMSKKFGVPYESMATPEEKQAQQAEEIKMVGEKAKATEQAKGTDTAYEARVQNWKDALAHKEELYGLLFGGQPDPAPANAQFGKNAPIWQSKFPGGGLEGQRINDLLKEVETAKRLTLTPRGVTPESVGSKGGIRIPGLSSSADSRLNWRQNPEALRRELESVYSTIEQTVKGIEKGGAVQAPVQGGNTFATEQEALASGIKGEVIIGGRRARID